MQACNGVSESLRICIEIFGVYVWVWEGGGGGVFLSAMGDDGGEAIR